MDTQILGQVLADLAKTSVDGIPLIIVVFGIVAWLKSRGVNGNNLAYASLAIGLFMGVGAKIAIIGMPADFAGWFSACIFGLLLGLAASGTYDQIDRWRTGKFYNQVQ